MTQHDRFPIQTAWTAILEAQDPASPERRARLERLAALYWNPVHNHLRLQWNLGDEELLHPGGALYCAGAWTW